MMRRRIRLQIQLLILSLMRNQKNLRPLKNLILLVITKKIQILLVLMNSPMKTHQDPPQALIYFQKEKSWKLIL